MIKQIQTVHCDDKNCSKKLTVEGGKKEAYEAVKSNGWQWKSADKQYCKDHGAVKAEKKTVKAKPAKKPAVKKVSKPVVKKEVKPKFPIDVAEELKKQEGGE